MTFLSGEPGWLETDNKLRFGVGDRLTFYPYYAPFTVNLYDKFHCIRNGTVGVLWDMRGRGNDSPGRRPGPLRAARRSIVAAAKNSVEVCARIDI